MPIIVIAVALLIAVAGHLCYRIFLRRRQSDAPISLVFLLRAPRDLTEQELRRHASEAFGMTSDTGNPDATEFVMGFPGPPVKGIKPGTAYSFMVKVSEGMFLVNRFSAPYMDRPEEFAQGLPDARLGKAVASHRAWISVDAFMGELDDAEKVRAYRNIGKLIAELAGPDCLAVYCPELQRCNVYDESLLETLRSDDPLALFGAPTFAPLVNVDGDDPRMVQAVEEARKRWPEFVAAFSAKSDEGKPFIVKARFEEGEKTEFMWASVNRIQGDTIHGILENTPHELASFKEGQNVQVPLADLNDWLYVKGEEAIGGFTMKVIAEAQKDQ